MGPSMAPPARAHPLCGFEISSFLKNPIFLFNEGRFLRSGESVLLENQARTICQRRFEIWSNFEAKKR